MSKIKTMYFCTAMIEIKNLFISFEKPVIENFSMIVPEGEKIAIVGSSGIGKSTILNSLMGFVRIQSGEIKINNLSLNASNIRLIRKQICWLPQELSMQFEMVEDLFYYPFSFAQNKPAMPPKSLVEEVLNKLKLDSDIMSKKTDEISGGQKQRVALASQLLLNKPILLMDEPSSALDDDSQKAVLDFIRSLSNVTLVSATHNYKWIDCMDRVVHLPELNLISR